MLSTKEYISLYKKCFEELSPSEQKQIQEFNKNLVDNYPFLKPRNVWTGKEIENYDYSFTWMDDMPDGWRIAFGDEFVEELKQELIKYPYDPKTNYDEAAVCENDTWLNHYKLSQVKEKFGSLRWYDNGAPGKVHDIISKYEDKSERTCIDCGEEADYISQGWISPYCSKCANKNYEYNLKRYAGDKMTIEEARIKYPFNEDYVSINKWFKKDDK